MSKQQERGKTRGERRDRVQLAITIGWGLCERSLDLHFADPWDHTGQSLASLKRDM